MFPLPQRGEAVHVGRVAVGAPLEESQRLVFVAGCVGATDPGLCSPKEESRTLRPPETSTRMMST